MNPNPFVSILIPAYNADRWIGDALRSALAQTWKNKEIIVVDDGSQDRTLEVARRFESAIVRVVHQDNQGAPQARNTAFSLSCGEYIQWLDADDILAPDKIEQQLKARDSDSADTMLISGAWGIFRHHPAQARFAPTSLWSDLAPVEWLIHKLAENIYMQTASWLVSRELSLAAGPWNRDVFADDDGEYFCRVLIASQGVRFVPDARVYYRDTGAGTLSYIGSDQTKVESHWCSAKKHIDYIRSLEDSPRVRAASLRYLQTALTYFYPEREDIFREAQSIAEQLGGVLHAPELSWKYAWIRQLCGWSAAKRAQRLLRKTRHWAERKLESALLPISDLASTLSGRQPRAGFEWLTCPSDQLEGIRDSVVHGR